jgi:hypothetical protein
MLYRSIGVLAYFYMKRVEARLGDSKKVSTAGGSGQVQSIGFLDDVTGAGDALDIEEKKASILSYINTVFPPVYDMDRSMWSSMYDEVIRHHAYITVFNITDKTSQSGKITALIHLLTMQSMLMFLMAVFYDLEVCCFSFENIVLTIGLS